MSIFARSTLIALCFGNGSAALALDINLTFDPSVSATFGVNTNSMTSAVAYVAQEYENLYANPITINFSVDGGTSGYAGSSTQWNTYSYSAIRSALAANATSPAQTLALSYVPTSDPSPPGSSWNVPNAEAKALGLLSATAPASDGEVSFNANVNWTFNPSNRAVPGASDFCGAVEHELSEVMGRIFNASPYVPYDLFRYDGGTNTLDMTNNTNVWFSINGGNTDLNSYNYHSQTAPAPIRRIPMTGGSASRPQTMETI